MITGWPRMRDITAPNGRPVISAIPPGGNGTTMVIGRFGYDCACAVEKSTASTNAVMNLILSSRLKSEFLDRVLTQLGLLHLAARRHADRLEVLDDAQVARHAEVRAARLA